MGVSDQLSATILRRAWISLPTIFPSLHPFSLKSPIHRNNVIVVVVLLLQNIVFGYVRSFFFVLHHRRVKLRWWEVDWEVAWVSKPSCEGNCDKWELNGYTVPIGYYNYIGTQPKNSHRVIKLHMGIVTGPFFGQFCHRVIVTISDKYCKSIRWSSSSEIGAKLCESGARCYYWAARYSNHLNTL